MNHRSFFPHPAWLLALVLFPCSLLRAQPETASASGIEAIHQVLAEPDGRIVLVAAHRALSGKSTGAWARHPENSLPAIEESIRKGVDVLEIDVRKTKDGQLVLMHDATVDRTTDGSGNVADLTLAELKRLRLRLGIGGPHAALSEERIPTLEEAMRRVRGKCMVNLDKASSLFAECHLVLAATDTLDHAILKSSASPAACRQQLSALASPIRFMPILSGKHPERSAQETRQQIASYQSLQPVAYELVFTRDRDPLIEAGSLSFIKAHGSHVWVNTLWPNLNGGRDDARSLKDPEQGWGWLLQRGVTIIQTDEAEQLLRYLQEQGRRW